MAFDSQSLTRALLYPARALYDKAFYRRILFSMRGLGFLYLLCLSLAAAVPASFKVAAVLERFQDLELTRLVAQLPPSFLDTGGNLSPEDGQESYRLLYSSSGRPSMVYNTEDLPLEGDALSAPIELRRSQLLLKSSKGVQSLPYSSFFEGGTSFSPLAAAETLEMAFNSSAFTIWSLVAVYFFSVLSFNTLVTAVIGKVLFSLICGIRYTFGTCLRFLAFSNTITALAMLLQYFMNLPLTYTVMATLPLIYVILTAFDFRRGIRRLGPEAFAAGLRAEMGGTADAGQRPGGPGSFAP